MKTSKNQNSAVVIGNVINLFIAAFGAIAIVYGLALYIVKYL
jgi:hypothetical protein